MMTGQQRVVFLVMGLALLLNFCVAYLTVPLFGIIGAAFANTLGMILWNCLCVVYVIYRLDFNTTIFYSKDCVK